MPNHLDTVFSPSLYLDRDKQAIAFIEDQLLHQETCAAVCMYGNGKDYLFTNIVKRFETKQLPYKLKVLNTISSDELRDFADMLEAETEPILCLINLRIHKDVSWFIQIIEQLRIKRGHAFVSFICAYVGDVYNALLNFEGPITKSLVILRKVPYSDALHIITELSDRFGFYPSEEQKQDIYQWSFGHVGLLRTLYLLKRQTQDSVFTKETLLHEPTILDRLQNIVSDLPADKMQSILAHRLNFVEKTFFEEIGYLDDAGGLFHPLLIPLVPELTVQQDTAFSLTEQRVLDYLRNNANDVVTREEIGRIVWGEEEWEDKYSDWAVSQLMYRLRKKNVNDSIAGEIHTRRGQGFIFVPASELKT